MNTQRFQPLRRAPTAGSLLQAYRTMMEKVIITCMLCVGLAACGENPAPANSNTTGNAAATKVEPSGNADKPASAAPPRIVIDAGKAEGSALITLASGQSKQFVVGARIGQILMIDANSKAVKISLTKGEVAKNATLEEPGHYDTTILENGDFVFEVKNTSQGELNASIKVIVSDTHASKR